MPHLKPSHKVNKFNVLAKQLCIRSIFNGNKNFLKKMSFLRKQESPVYKGDS